MVVAHEVFGHGSRLREIGAHNIRYSFDAPIPYGRGGAVTRFSGDVLVTRADALAIDTAGIEAQNVLADQIGRQALAAGALRYREAWLYLESRLDGLRYIRSVSPHSSEGHDVRAFLLDINDDCDPPACTPLSASVLKRRALSMLADPLLGSAAYSWAMSYIVQGRAFGPLWAIPLPHAMRYVPALRFEMTPNGTEWATDHHFVHEGHLMTVTVGVADTLAARAWRVGVFADDIVRRDRWTGAVEVNVWRQPSLDSSPADQTMQIGAFAALTARIRAGPSAFGQRASWFLQGGYKSDGFVRGERVRAGALARVGVSVSPRRR
jgi:hypothetical protein